MVYLEIAKPSGFRDPPASVTTTYLERYAAMSCLPSTKLCPKCKVKKPVSEFSKDKSRKDGLSAYCEPCRANYHTAYYKNNSQKIKNYQKAYRILNPEKIKMRNKLYQKIHPEGQKARSKKYKQRYPEKEILRHKIYNATNSEKIKIRQKEYGQTDRGKDLAKKRSHKRRAIIANSAVEDFAPSEIFDRDNYTCQLCGVKTRPDFKSPYHPKYPNLDHIIPLSLGGGHSKLNTQCLCRKCNFKKHNTGTGDQLRLFG